MAHVDPRGGEVRIVGDELIKRSPVGNGHDDHGSRVVGVAWRGSQEDLARVLGLSRVTVNRALARLAKANVLRLTPSGIIIIDHQRLTLFSNGS